MRVLCIMSGKWLAFKDRSERPGPKYGDELVVMAFVELEGHELYRFREYPNDAYTTKDFIPLDGPDETELLSERMKDDIVILEERTLTDEQVKAMIEKAHQILNDKQ